MKTLAKKLRHFLRQCGGPTAVEYAILLVLIVFTCFATLQLIGAFVADTTRTVAESLPTSVNGP